MIINKRVAIKAIETERLLEANGWFSEVSSSYYADKYFQKAMKTCSVCAVGSVLRAHCFTKLENKFDIPAACNRQINNSQYLIYFDTDKQNYLGNLSMLFEYKTRNEGIKSNSDIMRMHLINYIEGAWPDQFEVGVAE